MAGTSGKSLTAESLFLIGGRSVAFAFALLHPIILVRVFAKDEYGLYRQLTLIYMTLLPLGQMGASHGLYYFLPREPERRDATIIQTMLFVIALSMLGCAGLILLRHPVSRAFNSVQMASLLPLLGAYSFFMIGSSFMEFSMIAEGRSLRASIIMILSQLLHSVAVITSALWFRRISCVLWALIVFSMLRFAYQYFYLSRNYIISWRKIDFRFWHRQLSYVIPIGLANFAWLLQTRLHGFFVSFLFNPALYAVYSIGSFNLPIVGIVTSSVSNVMMPELARCHKEENKNSILNIWNSAMRKMNLILFPVFVFFSAMAYEFIVSFFTLKYAASVAVFRIALLSILIVSINTAAVLNAFAETRFLMRLAFLRIPLAMAALYLFTSAYGIIGAITADLIVGVGFRILEIRRVSRLLEIPIIQTLNWKVNGQILFISFLAGLPLVAVKRFITVDPFWTLVIGFPVYAFFYLVLVGAFGILNQNEKDLLKKILRLCSGSPV